MQLAIFRTYSLSDVAPGWDGCEITYTPLTLRRRLQLRDSKPEEFTNEQAADFMLTVIRDVVVKATVMEVDDNGGQQPGTITKENIDLLPDDVLGDFFTHISGASTDPKALKTKTETSPTVQPGNAPSSSETTTNPS